LVVAVPDEHAKERATTIEESRPGRCVRLMG
jgi:hypothetical protein